MFNTREGINLIYTWTVPLETRLVLIFQIITNSCQQDDLPKLWSCGTQDSSSVVGAVRGDSLLSDNNNYTFRPVFRNLFFFQNLLKQRIGQYHLAETTPEVIRKYYYASTSHINTWFSDVPFWQIGNTWLFRFSLFFEISTLTFYISAIWVVGVL